MSPVFLKKYNCNLIRLSLAKPVYYCENNPNIIVKTFRKEQQESMNNEFKIHKLAEKLVPCPKIIDYYIEDEVGYYLMERINGESINDFYGDNPKDVPKEIWKQIHSIINKLYYNDIHYLDITSYNFIIEKNTEKIYIIDFGDAKVVKINWFLKDFIDGENSWNPDFA